MTLGEYRALVAHMQFWKFGLEEAMKDCGIHESKSDVVYELFKANWVYFEETDTLEYHD